MNIKWTLLLSSIMACGFLAGCTDQQENQAERTGAEMRRDTGEATRDVGETTGDAATTGKVKTALLADTDVGAMGIDVDTTDGVVYLRGEVSTAQQKQKAEQIARDQAGDNYQIRNELQVDSDDNR